MSKTQEDLKILEGFVNALTIELAESKKRNIEKQIIIENGERGEKLGSKFLYTFFFGSSQKTCLVNRYGQQAELPIPLPNPIFPL